MYMMKSLLSGAAVAVVSLAIVTPANAATHARKHHHAVAAHSDAALAAQVKELREEVETLKSQLDAQTAAQQQTAAAAQTAQAQAQETAARTQQLQAEVSDQIQKIPGDVQTVAVASVKSALPKPGNVKVTMGGFAAAEMVYRSRNNVADIGSNYSKIPYLNNPLAHLHENRLTARQSRLSVLVQGDLDPTTHAAFYSELDFLGAAQTANSNESNSYNPRIRNVYAQVDWDQLGLHLLAGQNWSLVTMNSHGITPRGEVIPPTIEAQYVPGFVWQRTPQFRLTKDFADKQLWLAASIENPQTTFAGSLTGVGSTATGVAANVSAAGIGLLANVNNFSYNKLPDVIVKAAVEPDFGHSRPLHLEAFGIFRSFYDRVTYSAGNVLGVPVGNSSATTHGWGIGGGATFAAVPKVLDLQVSGLTGRGIGRYGSGQLPDVITGYDGRLKPIRETLYLAGATAHATSALDVYGFWGQERQSRTALAQVGSTFFGYGNPNASLANCFIEGASCSPDTREISQITVGLWDKLYNGKIGSLRFGLQYSHTKLDAFSGTGGLTPKTNDDMVFTSFRFYPNF